MDQHTLFLAACRLLAQGRNHEAVAELRRILELAPGHTEASLYLAMALRGLGGPGQAEPVLRRALQQNPADADLHNLLGVVLLEMGRPGQGLAEHRQALDIARGQAMDKAGGPDPTTDQSPNQDDPDQDAPHPGRAIQHPAQAAEALDGMGNCLAALGRHGQAVDAYQQALGLIPDSSPTLSITLSNLGAALKNAGRPEQAVKSFQAALRLAPEDSDTWANLGNALQDMGDMDAARNAHERAVQADPDSPAARWGLTMAHIPLSFDRQEDIPPARAAYGRALADLDAWLGMDQPRLVRAADQAAGRNQPFYLAYHGENDRPLQARYGALLHRVMIARFPEHAGPLPPRDHGGKFRLGLASGYFREHSVWKIPLLGWLAGLDRERFEIHCFHTDPVVDHCTDEARAMAHRFIHQPHDFPALVRAVAEAELDGLLYPEIGMDPACACLAALRLAPLQAVSLGHPMTTGLPTMDAFLSSALMEPEDGAEWYTEHLVRLPNLSIWYEPLRREPAPLTRADFGLDAADVAYFCPQSLFKYLPKHDYLFPAIASKVSGARFVFLEHRRTAVLTRRFRERLARAFADQGLDHERHLLFLDSQPPDRYLALARCCDIFLDSLGWAGFNTAMEAAGVGLSMVTCPQGPMRGRHGGAVAMRLGLDPGQNKDSARGVARSEEEYLELAVRAGLDADYRAALADKVRTNRDRLYRDTEPIRALEEFLLNRR